MHLLLNPTVTDEKRFSFERKISKEDIFFLNNFFALFVIGLIQQIIK